MKTIDMHTAKPHLSDLVEGAAAGEEILIAKAFGVLEGRIRASDDFDAPLPPELLREFGIDQ